MPEGFEEAGSPSLMVCRFFKKKTGTCKFGPACTMYHPDADGNSVRRAPATRRAPPPTTTATAHSLFPSDADAGSRPQDSDASVSLCRAWITSGHCPRMSTCKFRHGTCGVAIGKARAEWIAQRRQRQVRVKSGRCWQVRTLTEIQLRRANIPTTADDDVPPEEKQSYRARAAVLAQWMSETFRAEDLAQGVLDVAGGRGDLSFELTVSHSLRCTVVDPRPVRLTKHQHRRLTQALTALERTRPSDAYVAKVVAAAQHRSLVLAQAKALRSQGDSEGAVALLRRFESEDVAGVGICVENVTRTASASGEDEDEWWGGGEWPGDLFFQDDPVDDCNNVEEVQVPREKGAKSLAETLRLCRSSPDTCQCGSFLMAQEQAWFGERFESGGDLHPLTARAGVLCGLHPDGATDDIVRVALACKKPFCVVPCCVMRTRKPRVTADGRPVSSFEDYVAYLKSQDPGIQQAFLPFVGKNLVLFKTH